MTPADFFAKHPEARGRVVNFDTRVATMREAWMSDSCAVSNMLWLLGLDPANRPGLVAFASWCAEHARRSAASAETADSVIRAAAAIYAADAAATWRSAAGVSSSVCDAAADAAAAWRSAAGVAAAGGGVAASEDAEDAAHQAQRDKLRGLFPRQFIDPP